MLRESFHPDFLRDGLDRERFFDKLWMQVPKRPFLRRVIDAEQKALRQGDVPLFTTRPDSRRLWSSGGEILDDFFTESATELIGRRLGSFGARDLGKQQWLIRASIAIVSSQDPARDARRRTVPQRGRPASELRPSLLRLATAIGTHLGQSAIEDGESVQWLSLVPGRQGVYKVGAVGTDLYAGLAGVALFLAQLGHLTGDAAANRLAEKSCGTLLRRLRDEAGAEGSIGAFEGRAGAVYTLSHLAALWSRPALLDDALRLALPLADRIADDEALDVIDGSAGCALALATLHRLRPSRELLAILESCGERLVDRAVQAPQGVGWRTTGESEEPMTGFSHGASGIAAALFELWALSGREAFRDAARQGLAYEGSLFSAEHGNWPDLRVATGRFDQVNWCHGAPGIGLARTLAARHEDTPEIRAHLDAAVSTTLARGFGRNHSLCHGDLGNVDFLLEANALRPDPRLHAEIDRLAAGIAADVETGGWRCGLPMAVETPGLMTGLAGIGYGLLRLASPDRVPSVLALEPPRSARRAVRRQARRRTRG
jgi:type 2 lantibiotic biosynthesis protein LanM